MISDSEDWNDNAVLLQVKSLTDPKTFQQYIYIYI